MAKIRKAGRLNSLSKKHSVKVGNKQLNKLIKRGKVKKKVAFWRGKKVAQHDHPNRNAKPNAKPFRDGKETEREWEADDVLDMIEENDLSDLLHDAPESNRWNVCDEPAGKLARRKREREDRPEEYEKRPRTAPVPKTRSRQLLPLKGPDGLIPVAVEEDGSAADVGTVALSDGEPASDGKPRGLAELYAERERKLADLRRRVAVLACAVVENPEENVTKLKELVGVFGDKTAFLTARKTAALSLLEVFCDVVPGYRVRPLADDEKRQKSKKETEKLRKYETALLGCYGAYLEKLDLALAALRTGKKAARRLPAADAKRRVRRRLAVTAVRCLCRLLVAHPHFNYTKTILARLVPLLAHPDPAVAGTCFEAVRDLYRRDVLGEASSEAVKCTVRLVKSRNYRVRREVLDTFTYLRIGEADPGRAVERSPKDMNKERQRAKSMSRRENKRRKQLENLQKELLETEGEESRDKKRRLHTEILNCIFATYFRVLKSDVGRDLLAPVLEGLSKFAHLINVEFYDDLVATLGGLLRKGDLDNRESLYCLCTVFALLSGQGEVLNIDLQEFYMHLYKLILRIHAGITSGEFPSLLNCVEAMLTKRAKGVTFRRWLAFVKRLCTDALQAGNGEALGILATVRALLQSRPQTDVLLESEHSQGSGAFLPELDDPEHCNAHSTTLWELHPLLRHYLPAVARYAKYLLKGCPLRGEGQLPPDLLKMQPREFCQSYSTYSFDSIKVASPRATASRKLGKCRTDKGSVLARALQLACTEDDGPRFENLT